MEESGPSPASSNRDATPWSSVDLQANPSSPHHHSLHFPFRSPPNASYGMVPSAPPTVLSEKTLKHEAVRLAKRQLLAKVRDDWEYPRIDPAGYGEVAESQEPIGYACRGEGLSDLEHDETGSSRKSISSAKENNPYRFENPDAVAKSMTERKRKRRRIVEEELKWNEGLRTFSLRRDAWTKAVLQRPSKRSLQSQLQRQRNGASTNGRFSSDSTNVSADGPLTSGSAKSSDPSMPSSVSMDSIHTEDDPTSQLDGPWLPIFPPIIPADNIVRANIKPSAYNAIYSKVVVQSLTPSIPIPLSHMTYALVEGWKADGAWPPPTSATVPSVLREGKKKTGGLFNVMKMRRMYGHGNHANGHSKDGAGMGEKANDKMKRGVGAVKKVLGVTPGSDDEDGIDFEEADQEAETEANAQLNKGLLGST